MPKAPEPVQTPQNPFFPSDNLRVGGLSHEILRLLYLSAALVLLLALISYNSTDPSWSTWSTDGEVQNWIGRLGSLSADLLYQVFGLGAFGAVLVFFAQGIKRNREAIEGVPRPKWRWAVGAFLVLFAAPSLLQGVLLSNKLPFDLEYAGGLLGHALYNGTSYAFGRAGALIATSVIFVAANMLLFEWRIFADTAQLLVKIQNKLVDLLPRLYRFMGVVAAWSLRTTRRLLGKEQLQNEEGSVEPDLMPLPPAPVHPIAGQDEDFAHLTKGKGLGAKGKVQGKMPVATRHFMLPSPTMLKGKTNKKAKAVEKEWYLEKGQVLVEKLKDFGVDGEIVHIAPGPVITVYEFKPASGIKIREIANLSDDLTLALSVLSVRIVAPIPGKPVVGIEIPTPSREVVYFRDIVEETNFYKGPHRIPIGLGRLASGEPILTDLAAMPHLLVAGATGTGKSVFVNTLICSLLYRFAPQQLKLILVDPKMVELSHYEGIPHLLLPVVVEAKKAVLALRWLVEEMERRYKTLHEFGVRHIDGFNTRLNELQKEGLYPEQEFMPYIVTVIDEYADLMAVVPKDVEMSVMRLAQKARAAGIHIVLATQRPSTDVVTGTIKANFPSRISFRVASAVDSKTILDRTGAERLLGQGDMLFHSAGFSSLKRMQGSYIEDNDIEKVIDHLKSQGAPQYDEDILKEPEEGSLELGGSGDSEENKLYDMAVRLVSDKGEASISLIQRHLRIGYNRAATLMEQMEAQGVVGPATGASKRRPVLTNS